MNIQIARVLDQQLVVSVKGDDPAILSASGGMIDSVRSSELDGYRLGWWLGGKEAMLFIPFTLLAAFGRQEATNPCESRLKEVVAEYLAKNPLLRLQFDRPSILHSMPAASTESSAT